MEAFLGSWKFIESDNFDAYLKALGWSLGCNEQHWPGLQGSPPR